MDIIECLGRGERLDVEISGENLSRSRAAELIKEGHVRVEDQTITKPSFKVPKDARIRIEMPVMTVPETRAEDIPLQILYEDESLAIVHKPCGMVVHPAAGNENGTMVNALLFHLKDLSGIGGEQRPGIVHRLDKDTSGLLIVAKNDKAHLHLSRQLSDRTMEKHYFAVVEGIMKEPAGEVNAPIGRSTKDRKKMAVCENGRQAITKWKVVREMRDTTLLDIHLITGRTHQIRVHMAHIHHPVVGDPLYGTQKKPRFPRLMLHAYSIAFNHPRTEERMYFSVLPDQSFGEIPEGLVKPSV